MASPERTPPGGAAYITPISARSNKIGAVSCAALPVGDEPAIDRRQRLGKVLGNEPGTDLVAGFAVQPGARAGGLESRHTLGQEAGDDPGKHITSPGSRKPRRGIVD